MCADGCVPIQTLIYDLVEAKLSSQSPGTVLFALPASAVSCMNAAIIIIPPSVTQKTLVPVSKAPQLACLLLVCGAQKHFWSFSRPLDPESSGRLRV